uniref:Uncharacterized protein n=1 Tax=viral metagenome TaxID=1070528 RepID=A0A6C0F7Y3_9ZZZZ|tara:strand:+ start:6936 stop:7433 length:498 start_codon:yes stop_codon:yes gene_type:complete
MEIAIRSILYFVITMVIYGLMNYLNFNLVSSEIESLVVIGIMPMIINRIPIPGLKQLMMSGMQPMLSFVIVMGMSFIVMTILKYIKKSKSNDEFSKFLNGEDIEIGMMKFDRIFMMTLIIVIILEYVMQRGMMRYQKNVQNKNMEKVVIRSLEKFYKENSKCLNK